MKIQLTTADEVAQRTRQSAYDARRLRLAFGMARGVPLLWCRSAGSFIRKWVSKADHAIYLRTVMAEFRTYYSGPDVNQLAAELKDADEETKKVRFDAHHRQRSRARSAVWRGYAIWQGLLDSIDLKFRLVAISGVVLLGLGVVTFKSFEVADLVRTPPPAEQLPSTPPAAVVFPVGGLPAIWRRGSADQLAVGTSGDLASLSEHSQLCGYRAIIAFGTASGDGEAVVNRALARRRAEAIAGALREAAGRCPSPVPAVYPVAMFDPTEGRSDALQRKAFAIGIGSYDQSIALPVSVVEPVTAYASIEVWERGRGWFSVR